MSVSHAVTRRALHLATRIYRATPFRPLRETYFRAFLRMVRGRRVVRTVEGLTFELDLGELIDVGLFLQQYERDVVSVIEGVTSPGSTVIDIGANIGAHALRFASRVGRTGRVFAFEPMPFAFAKLERNVSLNDFPQLEIFRIALSDQTAAGQQVRFRSSWASTGERRPESALVDVETLDGWCGRHGDPDVQVIKLDVDGHEHQVVTGGLRTIERCRPVMLVEAGAWHFAEERRNPLKTLAGLGYRFWETSTLAELDLPAVRDRLPAHDEEMAFSINLFAAVRGDAIAPVLAARR